jgi:hypothetical protein
MKKRVTVEIRDEFGKFLTLLDLWDVPGEIKVQDRAISLGEQFITFGSPIRVIVTPR